MNAEIDGVAFFYESFRFGRYAFARRQVAEIPEGRPQMMKHEVLGEIKMLDGSEFDAAAMVPYDTRKIQFGLSGDEHPLEITLAFAADVARQLKELDQRAKSIAAANLCKIYNGEWYEYDEEQDDGSFKTITNPQLSITEFTAKLSLQAVNITGNSVLDFYYDDKGMFWGHSVVVSSMAGFDFSEARAELCS